MSRKKNRKNRAGAQKAQTSTATDAAATPAVEPVPQTSTKPARVIVVDDDSDVATDVTADPADRAAAMGAPVWTVRFYDLFGHGWGWLLFVALCLLIVPVSIIAVAMLLMFLSASIIGEVPALVLQATAVTMESIFLDNSTFLFRWVMPVLFVVITLAVLTAFGLRRGCVALIGWLQSVRRGLYAGHGETMKANRARRAGDRLVKANEKRKRREAEAGKGGDDDRAAGGVLSRWRARRSAAKAAKADTAEEATESAETTTVEDVDEDVAETPEASDDVSDDDVR